MTSERKNLLASHLKLVVIIVLSVHFFYMTLLAEHPECGKSHSTLHKIRVVAVSKAFELHLPRRKKPMTFFKILLSHFSLFCSCPSLFWLFCESLFETEKLDNVVDNCFLLKLLPPNRDSICIYQTMCSLITQDRSRVKL